MSKTQIDEQLKTRIIEGRKAVDAYRNAHIQLHSKPWHRGIPEEHTILFNKLINNLEKIGFTSTETDFEPKKTEILANFFEVSEDLNVQETGILEGTIRVNREDLSLIGLTSDMSPSLISEDNDMKLNLVEDHWGKEAELYIDDIKITSTDPRNHESMRLSVEQCPTNARVYVGGLGLGLVLLYLYHSGKTVEVVVCERNKHLIKLLANQIIQWSIANYPDFQLTIIKGMVFEEMSKHGKFDWIFCDLLSETHLIDAKLSLTARGIATNRHDFLYSHYSHDSRWWL